MIWLGSFWSRPPGKPPIVSIARWDPPWFKGDSIRLLSPQAAVWFKGASVQPLTPQAPAADGIPYKKDKHDWIESYKSILSEAGRIQEARRQLDVLLSEHGSILLACWCKKGRNRKDGSYSGNFCHRLLAGRLLHRLGYTVEVVDLECPRCSGSISFDGGISGTDFVCRECIDQRSSASDVQGYTGSHR